MEITMETRVKVADAKLRYWENRMELASNDVRLAVLREVTPGAPKPTAGAFTLALMGYVHAHQKVVEAANERRELVPMQTLNGGEN